MDNRADPIAKGTRNTNTVNLLLTTRCTMECPNCHTMIPRLKAEGTARHANVAQIILAGALMQPLRRVHLTGGEPTMHPEFEAIAYNVREWFGASFVTIETNGSYYRRYRHVFAEVFDRVFITHYVKDAIYPDNFDNTQVIAEAEQDLGDRLIREPAVTHLPLKTGLALLSRNEEVPCSKWHDPGLPCAWVNGLLYACCTTFGIDPSLGIPLTDNWREEIQKQPMGCSRCAFVGT